MRAIYKHKMPTVDNHGHHKAGNKAHKVWETDPDIVFVQKRFAVLWENEVVPVMFNGTYPGHGDAEGWTQEYCAIVGYGLLEVDRAQALEYFDLAEKVRCW